MEDLLEGGSVTRGPGDIARKHEIVLHAQEQAMIAGNLGDAVRGGARGGRANITGKEMHYLHAISDVLFRARMIELRCKGIFRLYGAIVYLDLMNKTQLFKVTQHRQ